MYQEFPDELYTNFNKTILDPCAGIGNLLVYCIKKRISLCTSEDDIYNAIRTVYGTELMNDNVHECHDRLYHVITQEAANKNIQLNKNKVLTILHHNIVCTDTFKWDYKHWVPKTELTTAALF